MNKVNCIYEVTVTLPSSQKEKALAYMQDKHILEVLKDPAFLKAQFFHREIDQENFEFTTHYYAHSKEMIEQYSAGYANEMKADFMKHFEGDSPKVSRRILDLDSKNYFLRDERPKTLFKGNYLEFNYRDGWECIDRLTCTDVVAIVAVNEKNELILVEQYRPALKKRVIELPAGLVNDGRYKEAETIEEAAQKELLEETGYWSESFQTLVVGPTSSGCISEVVTILRATHLEKRDEGGGVDNEDITVRSIPVEKASEELRTLADSGLLIDPKVYTGMYFLNTKLSE